MTPTPAGQPDDEARPIGVERGAAVSTEAEWGLRALIMVLLVFLRWAGRDLSTTETAEATPSVPGPEAIGETPVVRTRRAPAPVAPEAGEPELVSSARRRTAFASAVAVAGTAAWIAGRRSAGRAT